MKSNTIRALLLITGFFTLAVSGNAQQNVDSNVQHNLAIKWSPLGLYFGKLTLGGEYSIRKKQSITFYVGIPVGIQRNFDADNNTADVKSKTTSVMAGYRFYLGKDPMKGFYFEPYLKYLHNELEEPLITTMITHPRSTNPLMNLALLALEDNWVSRYS
jgi:hypothetical protein